MLTHNATRELACCQAKIIIQVQSREETMPEHIAVHPQHSGVRGAPRVRMTG
jgi:hypothetical protein